MAVMDINFQSLITKFGTKAAIARFFGVSQVAVGKWEINGLPKGRMYEAKCRIKRLPTKSKDRGVIAQTGVK